MNINFKDVVKEYNIALESAQEVLTVFDAFNLILNDVATCYTSIEEVETAYFWSSLLKSYIEDNLHLITSPEGNIYLNMDKQSFLLLLSGFLQLLKFQSGK